MSDIKRNMLEDKNRQDFYLKTLRDFKQELRLLDAPQKIMEVFLLTAMGAMGISAGFVLMIDRQTHKEHIAERGFESDDIKRLQENIPEIVKRCFSDDLETEFPSFMDARIVENSANVPFWPANTEILIQCFIDNTYSGLAGFSPKILDEGFHDKEIEFLMSLTDNMMFSIHKAYSLETIRQLNLELQKKDTDLAQTIRQLEYTRKSMDQQLFHLKSFSDIFLELSGLKDPQKILETFLLMVIGILSVNQAGILLFDRREMSVLTAFRGIEKQKIKTFNSNELKKIITEFFDTTGLSNPVPMTVQPVTDKRLVNNPLCPVKATISFLFVLNDSCMGLICLGDRITRQNYSEAEQELLLAITGNFLMFLDKTRSFETIQKLNVDLEKQNVELSHTIEELKTSRHRIEVLERAKARIKFLVRSEMVKTGRFSKIDILLILCLGIILGLIYNYASPGGVDLIPQILLQTPASRMNVQEAKTMHDKAPVLFVDARPPEFYKLKHIARSVNLPLALFDFVYMMKLSSMDPQKEIIVYGRNISRHYDEEVVIKLTARGHQNVKVLAGGLDEWEKNRYPVGP